jgi:hypothetical protein
MKGREVSQVQLYPLNSALNAGGWSTPHASCHTPHKDAVAVVQDAGWAPEPVWTDVVLRENISEHSSEAYLSKVFARTKHRCHKAISFKILDSKTSRNFPNSDMM